MSRRNAPRSAGSPQIYRYLKLFQENPSSRVFAPLAEAYRKAGLVEEALEVAREGLRVHPNFVGGKVALARALFDQRAYSEVVATLEPVIDDVPDNLVAQRLLAESQLMLGNVPKALQAYKMLLYFSPHELDTARIVYELESQLYDQGEILVKAPDARPAREAPAIDEFKVQPVAQTHAGEPDARRRTWMKRVEALQSVLLRVERYRRAASSL
ncbi:MAG: hypothetical protein IT285_00390 [Bdellovibrionales bacterium]|nr:hypothetical protein [Bdellovibrionales bacterium]